MAERIAPLQGAHTRQAVPPRRFHWTWTAAIAAGAVVLFLCYVRLSGTFPVGSDGASNSLEAWDMLHGNWLLHGWLLTDVSFYTTELPEYVLVELARGLNPSVVHIASAITYTLLVILAGLLAKGAARGREGWARALIAAGIMIAPQLGNAVHVLLSQPDHVGTQVPILVIFLVLDRAPRRWYTPVAIGVLLALVVLADEVAILNAAVPLAVACALRALWAVARRRERVAAQWFELSLIAAAAAGTAAGELAVRVIHRLGGFALMPVESGLATRSQLPAHLWLAVQGVLNLFGADVVGSPPGAQTVFAWLHMIGLALAVAGFAVAVRQFFSASPDGLLVAVLVAGIVVSLGSYVSSIIPGTLFDTREIAAVLPFGAVLAGRLLAAPLLRARLTPVLVAAACCYLAALGYGVAQPQPGQPRAGPGRLALGASPEHRARHLHRGQRHHAGQRRQRAAADGVLAAVRRRAARVPVDDLLVLPRDALRELRGRRHRRRAGGPDPAPRDPRARRAACADVPFPVVHDHGLGQEPARRSRLAPDAEAGDHRLMD